MSILTATTSKSLPPSLACRLSNAGISLLTQHTISPRIQQHGLAAPVGELFRVAVSVLESEIRGRNGLVAIVSAASSPMPPAAILQASSAAPPEQGRRPRCASGRRSRKPRLIDQSPDQDCANGKRDPRVA